MFLLILTYTRLFSQLVNHFIWTHWSTSNLLFLHLFLGLSTMEATAKFDFEAKAEDDLSFKRGDCLKVRITHTQTCKHFLGLFLATSLFTKVIKSCQHAKTFKCQILYIYWVFPCRLVFYHTCATMVHCTILWSALQFSVQPTTTASCCLSPSFLPVYVAIATKSLYLLDRLKK